VRVSSDDGVRIEHVVLVKADTSEVLKVDLMDNTRARGYNLEVVEGFGAPLEELEALTVASELEFLVEVLGVECASSVDLDRVINDEVNGAEGVYLGGVTTETLHGVTHGSEINDGGHTTERIGLVVMT
jgi:hypothetical protein